MGPIRFSNTVKQLGLASALGLSLVLSVTSASQAQELPTGAARVVQKVQLMALTGTNEIKYKVDLIVENNAGKFPHP
jgi:hypothetical protein